MGKPANPNLPTTFHILGRVVRLYLVPFFTDFGFKVAWVKCKLFPKTAIQALLDLPKPIETLTLVRNELAGLSYFGKGSVFDVVCTDEHRRVYIVEMQVGNYEFLVQRLLFYLFQEYCSLVPKGGKESGFKDLPPVYCICIVKGKCMGGTNYHQRFLFRSDEGEVLHPDVQLHLFELGKFPILRRQTHLVKTNLQKLFYTMKFGHTINSHDKEAAPDFFKEEWLKEPISLLELATMPPQKRAAVERTLVKAASIREAVLSKIEKATKRAEKRGEKRGEQRGEQRGELKTVEKIVVNMYGKGNSTAFIAESTELTEEQVQEIISRHEEMMRKHSHNGSSGLAH